MTRSAVEESQIKSSDRSAFKGRPRGVFALASSVTMTVAFAAMAYEAPASGPLRAEIRTTSYGVPHVIAKDTAGAGFGIGYAFAQTDICEIAGRWVTVSAQRSRYFGPDEKVPTYGDKSGTSNLQSDFFWQWIIDTDVVGRELREPSPRGPTPEVREMVRGYVAGYNLYLAKTGVDKIPDARCRGAAWVRPITEKDVYLRALHWSLFATSVNLIPSFVNATPPAGRSTTASPPVSMQSQGPGGIMAARPDRIGSNMIALGKDATDNGRGMLFANPHWYWNGPERFLESQITIPGKLNVYGVSTLGMPMILLGHTEHAAWSHTVSTPARATVYQLQLAPEDPTSYLYDGQVHKLTSRSVRVQAKTADGKLSERSHTFWETSYGLLLQDENFAWTAKTAYAVRDVTMSLYWMNKEMAMDHAQSVDDIQAAGRRYLGIPWLNTIASDSSGKALYADNTAIPHVTDAMLDSCVTSQLGKHLLDQRTIVLDGWRSACAWGNDADSIQPGTFGPAELPQLVRSDYVTNSNDSYWTNNPHQLLEGYPKIMGKERTARTLRTRIGLYKLERRLGAKDGLPGNRFTLANLEAITMNDKVLSGELWRDAAVTMCRSLPETDKAAQACDVLAKWDQTDNIDSPGAVLWRRFYDNMTGRSGAWSENVPAELFAVAFDPKDPMNTPRGLNTDNPKVRAGLIAAIADLRNSGMPLDASLRAYQYVDRNGTHIPIPGGPGGPGQYNDIESKNGWIPGRGWPEVFAGSSFVMWTQFTDGGPKGRSILTYSESNNPDSVHHSDQTKLFSERKSKPILFSEAEIAADPNLTTVTVCDDGVNAACK